MTEHLDAEQLAAKTQVALAGCLQCIAEQRAMLHSALPGLDDEEGERVADDLPPVVDAHMHLFDEQLFAALWRWFDANGWPVRYRDTPTSLAGFLPARGVERALALHYAHKPGIARGMNRFLAELCADHPAVRGTATVFPGEPDAPAILEEAFALGLRAVKLHCHVQCASVDGDAVGEVLQVCEQRNIPVIIHAGREPKSPAYKCDPHELCDVDKTSRALTNHPRLRMVVPHLGADEFAGYARLLERHDNLWLDSTMMLAGYFPIDDPAWMVLRFPERVLYGTDFPNLPYAWDREIRRLATLGLRDRDLARVLGENARVVYDLA